MQLSRLLSLIVISLLLACSRAGSPHSPAEVDRNLTLAFEGEFAIKVLVNGQPPSQVSDTFSFSISRMTPTFGILGGSNDKIIIAEPHFDAPLMHYCGSCESNGLFWDGISRGYTDDASVGNMSSGLYRLKVNRDGNGCTYDVAITHIDRDGDGFLDYHAGDQKLVLNYPSSDTSCAPESYDSAYPKLARPSTWVDVSVNAPSTVDVGDTVQVSASATGGFGSYQYVLNPEGSSTTQFDFSGKSFGSTNSWSHVYNTAGSYTIAVAVKDQGTTGGIYDVATRTIDVVDPDYDDALAMGHLFPSAMSPGSYASVGVVMDNNGTTTWSSSDGYELSLYRDSDWSPFSVPLSSSVDPGGSHSFTFDLQAPSYEGTFAAFYRMYHLGFSWFGEENGRYIEVSSGGGGGISSASASDPVTGTLSADPVTEWSIKESPTGEGPLVLDRSDLQAAGIAAVDYTYWHAAPRTLDVVFRFRYDPSVLIPLRIPAPLRLDGLDVTAGHRGKGEYWVRLSGTVPAGTGRIVAFPFRLRPGAPIPPEFGDVTLFYAGS